MKVGQMRIGLIRSAPNVREVLAFLDEPDSDIFWG